MSQLSKVSPPFFFTCLLCIYIFNIRARIFHYWKWNGNNCISLRTGWWSCQFWHNDVFTFHISSNFPNNCFSSHPTTPSTPLLFIYTDTLRREQHATSGSHAWSQRMTVDVVRPHILRALLSIPFWTNVIQLSSLGTASVSASTQLQLLMAQVCPPDLTPPPPPPHP